MLYRAGTQIAELREIGFPTEKAMQKFCEKNMETLLGLRFVASEFGVAQFRFDSVAYNATTNAFVIIEYKNDRNFSVVDQGYSYIATLLNHKADFVLKYNQVFNVSKGLGDFDWTQVRVYFVAPQYTKYQLNSINFSDLPMELWKIKRYEQDIIQFEQIKPTSTGASITGYVTPPHGTVTPDPVGGGETPPTPTEVIVYTEDDRLKDGTDASRELYMELREYIMSLDDDISMKPTKLYVGFQLNNHNLVDIKLQKNSIVLWLNTLFGTLDDPRGLITDVTHIGHHGNGDCQIKIKDNQHMGYIKDLILAHYRNQVQ